MKILSFNVRVPALDDGINAWTFRKSGCKKMIKDVNPDIICLQEAKPNQIKFFSNLGYRVAIKDYNAILYKDSSVKNVHAACFPFNMGQYKTSVSETWFRTGDILRSVTNIHPNWGDSWEEEVKVALKMDNNVVVGDFNNYPDFITPLAEKYGYVNLNTTIPTFHDYGKCERIIDTILVKNWFENAKCTIIDSTKYRKVGYISDHHPLLVEIQ